MNTPPEHDSEVSPGFAEAAMAKQNGSCQICGRAASKVIFIRRDGRNEIVECRCEKHLTTPTTPTPTFTTTILILTGLLHWLMAGGGR